MSRVIRSHRLAPFLALLLFLTSSLPLVQHACAMAHAAMMDQMEQDERCCCDREADAHEKHRPPAAAPCPHNELPSETHAYQLGDCCKTSIHHTTSDGVMLAKVSLKPAATAFIQVSSPTFYHPRSTDLFLSFRPKAPPQGPPLHLLYATFLN